MMVKIMHPSINTLSLHKYFIVTLYNIIIVMELGVLIFPHHMGMVAKGRIEKTENKNNCEGHNND
jgi:hypothetical protein